MKRSYLASVVCMSVLSVMAFAKGKHEVVTLNVDFNVNKCVSQDSEDSATSVCDPDTSEAINVSITLDQCSEEGDFCDGTYTIEADRDGNPFMAMISVNKASWDGQSRYSLWASVGPEQDFLEPSVMTIELNDDGTLTNAFTLFGPVLDVYNEENNSTATYYSTLVIKPANKKK